MKNWQIMLFVFFVLIVLSMGVLMDEGYRYWQEAHRPIPKQVHESIATKDITADKWATDKETFVAKDNKGNSIGTVTIEDRERIDTLNAASGVVKKERRRTVIIDVNPPTKDNMLGVDRDWIHGGWQVGYMRRFEIFGVEIWGNVEGEYIPLANNQVEYLAKTGLWYAF